MNKYLWIVVIIIVIAGYFLVADQDIKNNKKVSSSQVPAPTACTKLPTPQLMEGPYYKTGSPMRNNLIEDGVIGIPLTITGYVYDTNCQKVINAWTDFWQADGNGVYDNSGYKLRGHQFTDSEGKYTLHTVIPGKYPGRTPHIHVKLRASEKSPILTSQLFMPGESQNKTDSIFNRELIMNVRETEAGKIASFNFVITIVVF